MTDEQLEQLAFLMCAAIDNGEPCEGEPCDMCVRKAQAAEKFFAKAAK